MRERTYGKRWTRWLVGVWALLGAPALSQTIWVVDDDGGPGVAFTDIQPAVDAAADGDTVLIHAGTYSGFTVDGVALVLVGDVDGPVVVDDGQVRIENLAAHQSVTLRRLQATAAQAGLFQPQPRALELVNAAGPIWIEDVFVTPMSGPLLPGLVGGGVLVADCVAVTFSRCTLEGNLASPPLFGSSDPAVTALVATNSSVALYDTVLRGGDAPGGGPGGFGCGQANPAGSGAVVTDGFLFASGCDFLGGTGGDGSPAVSIPGDGGDGADGGDGLCLDGISPVAVVIDCAFAAGTGGDHGGFACTDGVDGAAVAVKAGSLATLPGTARSFSASSPVREGGTVDLLYAGEVGDLAFAAVALDPAFLYLPSLNGVLSCSLPVVNVEFLGTVLPPGTLAVSLPVQAVASGVSFHLQAGALATTGLVHLASPSVLTLLDAAF